MDHQPSEASQHAEPQENLLASALKEFLEDKPVTTSHSKSHGCRIAFAFEREAGAQTSYSRDVAPVLQKHCVQCHREGGIGPWNMDGYGHVKNYSKMMQEVLLTGQMPPWIRKSACILASNHGTKCSSASLMLPMTPEQPRRLL